MKIFKMLIVLLLMLLSGCLAHWKYFVHDETESVRRPPDDAMFIEAKNYVRNGVLVRPSFAALFNDSDDISDGGITFVSKKPQKVFISRLVILDGAESPLTIPFKETIVLEKLDNYPRFYFDYIDLEDVSGGMKKKLLKRFARAFEEGEFTMKIYFRVDQGELHEFTFKMRVEDAKDIAWGT